MSLRKDRFTDLDPGNDGRGEFLHPYQPLTSRKGDLSFPSPWSLPGPHDYRNDPTCKNTLLWGTVYLEISRKLSVRISSFISLRRQSLVDRGV